jgi:hypothetical protein
MADPVVPEETVDPNAGYDTGFNFSASVASDYKLKYRPVAGFGANITDVEKATLDKQILRSPKQARQYNGSYLVDDQGLIARKPYDPNRDVEAEMYGLMTDDNLRSTVQSLLYSRGFYGSSKPSARGTLSVDRTAFKEFLNYANSEGYTWKPLLAKISAMPMVKGLGGGAKYRVSAPEDITEYLRKASLEKLGRTMSKEDVDKAIAAIQQTERTKGPSAPALSVAAAQQVSAADPDREKSVRFRRGIDIAMNLLGG